jgi:hypothetical protein
VAGRLRLAATQKFQGEPLEEQNDLLALLRVLLAMDAEIDDLKVIPGKPLISTSIH